MKIQNAIIIGFGSSGKRYAKILKKNKNIAKVFVVSQNKNCSFKRYENLNEIKDLDFSLVVISSKTSDHYNHLKFIENNFKNKKIIVEKPLFSSPQKLKIKNNKVYVGYNLRFDPMIKFLKKIINKRKSEIIFSNLTCLSFLPSWKKKNTYDKSYHSSVKYGGGVTRDLSHEIDLGCYLFGLNKIKYAINSKKSPLKINTDDFSNLLGEGYKKCIISISLNYYFHKEVRQIHLGMKNKSYIIDLISRKFVSKTVSKEKLRIFKKTKDRTYYDLVDDVIQNKKNCCNFYEGMKVNQIIGKFKTL